MLKSHFRFLLLGILFLLSFQSAAGTKDKKQGTQTLCIPAFGMWGQLVAAPEDANYEEVANNYKDSIHWPSQRDPEYHEKVAKLFGYWLRHTPADIVYRDILLDTAKFKKWFIGLRNSRSERSAPEVKKWWTFFTDDELRIIYRTRKVFIPQSVVRSLGEKPFPEFDTESLVLKSGRKKDLPEKSQAMIDKFESWILETPLEEFQGKLNRRDLWFKNWFWQIRGKTPYMTKRPTWWTLFQQETLHKLKAAGVKVPDEAFDSPHHHEGGT